MVLERLGWIARTICGSATLSEWPIVSGNDWSCLAVNLVAGNDTVCGQPLTICSDMVNSYLIETNGYSQFVF